MGLVPKGLQIVVLSYVFVIYHAVISDDKFNFIPKVTILQRIFLIENYQFRSAFLCLFRNMPLRRRL